MEQRSSQHALRRRTVLLTVAVILVGAAPAHALSITLTGGPSNGAEVLRGTSVSLAASYDLGGCDPKDKGFPRWYYKLPNSTQFYPGYGKGGDGSLTDSFPATSPGPVSYYAYVTCNPAPGTGTPGQPLRAQSETRTFNIVEKLSSQGPKPTLRDDCALVLLASASFGQAQFGVDEATRRKISAANPKTADGKALKNRLLAEREQLATYYAAIAAEQAAWKAEANRIDVAAAQHQYSRSLADAAQERDRRLSVLGQQLQMLRERDQALFDRVRKRLGCREGRPVAPMPNEIRFSSAEKRVFEQRRMLWTDLTQKVKQFTSAICFVNSAKDALAKPAVKEFVTKFLPGVGLDLSEIPNDLCSGVSALALLAYEEKIRLNANLAGDPPRLDFRTATHRPKIPVLRAKASQKSARAALARLLHASLAEALNGQAMLTAVERAQGAILGRNRTWVLRQLAAARKLLAAQRKAVSARATAQRRGVKALRKAKQRFTVTLDPTTAAAATDEFGERAPALLHQMLAWKLSPRDALLTVAGLYKTPTPAGVVKFPDVLGVGSSRKQVAAELSALRGLDRRLKRAAARVRRQR